MSGQHKPTMCNWSKNTRKFTRAEILRLIHLYKENPCLWNVKCRDYTRTGLKKKAYEEMAQTFNVTISEIKRKIRSIRNTYLIEKKKVDESRNFGGAGKDLYEPKLAWFEEMEFLNESILMRRKILTYGPEDSQPPKSINYIVPDPPQFEQPSVVSTKETTPKEKVRKSGSSKLTKHRVINRILKTLKNGEEDTYLAFGKSIALQLKNLPQIDSFQAMREIQAITTAYTVNYISKRNSLSRP